MSHIEVYVERPNGDVQQVTQISNPFQGALFIWLEMAKRYGLLPQEDDPEYHLALGRALAEGSKPDGSGAIQRLWAMAPELAETNPRDAYVLGMTFDRVLVLRNELLTLARYLREWMADYGETVALIRLYDVLLRIARPDCSNCLAVGFNHSSVAESLWFVYDETTQDWRDYNTHTDEGHWYLSLEALRGEDDDTRES